ncbi:nucleolar-like protein [Thalictrum thalictroides]|uniref:Nucleolar-like protein n=1 Tax=Thalictrum thalictroides TaxID=46969 RepID=A0A7J6XEN2_THATH|nr:nucleolar-like protein [Thalictrum thalictroides]
MFNAILRESVDDIPTDPISDPIRDSKVLPIPAGNSSVGVGAQLKNVVQTRLAQPFSRNEPGTSCREKNGIIDER